jgi:hypothetical protein
VYYVGLLLCVLGFLSFFSTFLVVLNPQTAFNGLFPNENCINSSGVPSADVKRMFGVPQCGSFEHQIQKFTVNPPARAFGGMFLIFIGGILMGLGKAGLRGSGVLLDPQGARSDLEPFNRATGGMIQDVLEEIPALHGLGQPQTVVKIKCRSCSGLNAENAKFCNQCGQVL